MSDGLNFVGRAMHNKFYEFDVLIDDLGWLNYRNSGDSKDNFNEGVRYVLDALKKFNIPIDIPVLEKPKHWKGIYPRDGATPLRRKRVYLLREEAEFAYEIGGENLSLGLRLCIARYMRGLGR